MFLFSNKLDLNQETHFTILVGSSLVWKYYTRVEVNDRGKQPSLLRYGKSYGRKVFNSTGP